MNLISILICLVLNMTSLQTSEGPGPKAPLNPLTDTIPANRLVEETWMLAKTIEDVHPEPYSEAGGRISYYRKIHEIISLIPEEGMTAGDYYFLARQLVALMPDSHTWMNDPALDPGMKPGLPLFCTYLQGDLIILALYDKQHESIIGSKLIKVEGVSIDTLLERIEVLMNSENRVQSAHLLSGTYGFLSYRHLSRILPEWTNKGKISVIVEDPEGKRTGLDLFVPDSYAGLNLIYHPSSFQLPNTDKCDFAWNYTGKDSSVALLVVKGTMDFRENFEIWNRLGIKNNLKRAPSAFQRYNGNKPPEDMNEIISGLPSASEFIKDMLIQLKKNHTPNLVIDLRENEGGTSFFADILLYYLFGREELFRIKADYNMITRLSEYYYKYAPGTKKENTENPVKAINIVSDYDFSKEYNPSKVPVNTGQQKQAFEEWVAMMSSFASEYNAGTFEKYYTPKNIIVLTGTQTYSAGLTFAVQLSKAGAKIAGTASRQSPNCFGDALVYRLPYSGLTCNISHKKFEYFPGNAAKGKILEPDIPINYEEFKNYDFDLNAEILLILGMIEKQQPG